MKEAEKNKRSAEKEKKKMDLELQKEKLRIVSKGFKVLLIGSIYCFFIYGVMLSLFFLNSINLK